MAASIDDYRFTCVFFMSLLIMLGILYKVFPSELAIPYTKGFILSPVLLLEFATDQAQLEHIFGTPDDPLRHHRVTAMSAGNMLEYLIMPLYAMFLYSFFQALAKELRDEKWTFLSVLSIAAAVSDAVENFLLFEITNNIDNVSTVESNLHELNTTVWVKYCLLSAICTGAGRGLFIQRRWILGLFCFPVPFLCYLTFLDAYYFGSLLGLSIVLAWFGMGLHAMDRATSPLPPKQKTKK